jgi:hypothetical protein
MPELDLEQVILNKKAQLNTFIRMFSAVGDLEDRAVSRSDGRG